LTKEDAAFSSHSSEATACVDSASHWRERLPPLITDIGSEADSEGSGPLPSAAGAKGEDEGETAPFGFPLVGAGRNPQETVRVYSRRPRVVCVAGCGASPPRASEGRTRRALVLPSRTHLRALGPRVMGLVFAATAPGACAPSSAACGLCRWELAAHAACCRGGDRGMCLPPPTVGVGHPRREADLPVSGFHLVTLTFDLRRAGSWLAATGGVRRESG